MCILFRASEIRPSQLCSRDGLEKWRSRRVPAFKKRTRCIASDLTSPPDFWPAVQPQEIVFGNVLQTNFLVFVTRILTWHSTDPKI